MSSCGRVDDEARRAHRDRGGAARGATGARTRPATATDCRAGRPRRCRRASMRPTIQLRMRSFLMPYGNASMKTRSRPKPSGRRPRQQERQARERRNGPAVVAKRRAVEADAVDVARAARSRARARATRPSRGRRRTGDRPRRAAAVAAASTLAYQSRQPVASRSAVLPQWPASCTAWTVKPASCRPRATKRISVGVPVRPWISSTPERPPRSVKSSERVTRAIDAAAELGLARREHLVEQREAEVDLLAA